MQYVDLHCHSTASDGTLSPRQVVQLANQNSLSALALTDHDTVAGVADAADEAQKLGIDFIPGIEISAEFPNPGTMHILGYGVNPAVPSLRDLTKTLMEGRDNRNPKIIEKLNQLHIPITMDEVTAEAGGKVIGRPHIAAVLIRKGFAKNIKQAFNQYLAPGGIAYFDKERLSPKRAIELIHESEGLAVLAHPIQLRYFNTAELELIVKNLVDVGIDGIEVLHSDHSPELTDQYATLAKRYNLLTTGGSDFHGTNKPKINLGQASGRRVPREMYEKLRDRLKSR